MKNLGLDNTVILMRGSDNSKKYQTNSSKLSKYSLTLTLTMVIKRKSFHSSPYYTIKLVTWQEEFCSTKENRTKDKRGGYHQNNYTDNVCISTILVTVVS